MKVLNLHNIETARKRRCNLNLLIKEGVVDKAA